MSSYYHCSFCGKDKNYTNIKQISAHLSFCQHHSKSIQELKNKVTTKQINLNDGNLLHKDYVFNQESNAMDSTLKMNDGVDFSLFERHNEHKQCNVSNAFNINNADYHCSILLLEILQDAGCPLNVFDKIVAWAKKCYMLNVKFDEMFSPNRAQLLRDIDSLFNLQNLKPKIKHYNMKSTGEDIPVVHVEFLDALYSLLSDDVLMHPDNLLDDNKIDSEILDDINSGSVYNAAKQFYVKDPKCEKIIPIIFFIDKTHTDINGRLKLEPLMFTLGIFKRKCRANPMFWRTLGFVTDTTDSKKAKGDVKLQDYHNMLDIILSSYKQSQQKALRWEFKNSDHCYESFNCYMPCLNILGDTEGHDKQCGRYQTYTNVQSLC